MYDSLVIYQNPFTKYSKYYKMGRNYIEYIYTKRQLRKMENYIKQEGLVDWLVHCFLFISN